MRELSTPRDAIMLETGYGDVLVTAVDSCGGIGMLPNDAFKIDPFVAGLYTARVALLEVLAVGASPSFATLAVASGPATAETLLGGVRALLGELPLAISTEKNMPTTVTGFGVTVVGRCEKEKLIVGRAKAGDTLFCAGLPLMGEETQKEGARLFDVPALESLFADPAVRSLVPVGSRGVAAEAGVLAEDSGLAPRIDPGCGVDLYKSAGPSTCAVFAARGRHEFNCGVPVFEIGSLVKL